MILREYTKLPPPKEALKTLEANGSIHLVGPRSEALRALLIGPALSLSICLFFLWWMVPSLDEQEAAPSSLHPLWFLLGPILGALGSLGWLLYSLRLLRSPRVETGIHCTKERVMTFALRRGASYHELAWEDCEGFFVKDEQLIVRLSPAPTQGTYIDQDFCDEDGAYLNLPSPVEDVEALGAWLEELRRSRL